MNANLVSESESERGETTRGRMSLSPLPCSTAVGGNQSLVRLDSIKITLLGREREGTMDGSRNGRAKTRKNRSDGGWI